MHRYGEKFNNIYLASSININYKKKIQSLKILVYNFKLYKIKENKRKEKIELNNYHQILIKIFKKH